MENIFVTLFRNGIITGVAAADQTADQTADAGSRCGAGGEEPRRVSVQPAASLAKSSSIPQHNSGGHHDSAGERLVSRIVQSSMNHDACLQVGQLTFPLLCDLLDGVVTVTDAQMAEGCRILAERMKVMVEAASGAAIAAVMSDTVKEMAGVKRIGVILCGGNVDTGRLPWLDPRVHKNENAKK